MRDTIDDRTAARTGICARIDRIERDLHHLSIRRLCDGVDEVRSLALAHQMAPVAAIARSLTGVLADQDRRALVRPYLQVMREAAGCDRSDAAAGEAYLAAVGVRLAH